MLDYEAKIKEQAEQNKKDLVNIIYDKKIVEKIRKYCEDKHWPVEYVQELIINGNREMIDRFAISPQKQTNHQAWAAEYIKSFNGVYDFSILPQGGAKALYLVNGNVVSGMTNLSTKAIDFYFKVNDKIFYASHKYTKDLGGAQDNQFVDLKAFMENAQRNTNPNFYFIAICDGEYYQSKDSKYSKETNCTKTKQQYLNEIFSSKRCFAMTVEELKDFIESEA